MKDKRIKNKQRECISCGGTNLIFTNGQIVCSDCGIIQNGRLIDHGPEWRSFEGQKNNKVRVKMHRDTIRHDKGMYTYIGNDKKDAKGKSFSPKRRKANRSIRYWQKIMNTDNKTLQTGFQELKRLASQLHISKPIRNAAAKIFEDAVDNKLANHYSIIIIIAASLYIASRQYDKPRTFAEISKYSEANEKKIGAASRLIRNKLKLKISPTSPANLIPRFCSKLNLDEGVVNTSLKFIKRIEEHKIFLGKNPLGTVGAIIYLSSNQQNINLSPKKIAEILDITELTITDRVSDINKIIPDLIEYPN
ncbi:MAG: hypothetical protein GF329_16150 [Candidatus Lokiarchaeota archaeon]|nr:hypothetical protein [Candidatus Lokiarchaeota archaeon]